MRPGWQEDFLSHQSYVKLSSGHYHQEEEGIFNINKEESSVSLTCSHDTPDNGPELSMGAILPRMYPASYISEFLCYERATSTSPKVNCQDPCKCLIVHYLPPSTLQAQPWDRAVLPSLPLTQKALAFLPPFALLSGLLS